MMDNYDVMAGSCPNCIAADEEIERLETCLEAVDRETVAALNADQAKEDAFIVRLTAADTLATASKDAVKFIAKYVADTESVIAKRALDRLETTLREYEETQ